MESHDEERAAYKQLKFGLDSLKTDLGKRMSQLSANAAFFFTVTGPKMIWQFGELGYDISIEENGRTGKKPIKWEYQNEPKRKELHNTYARLIDLRIKFPQLFTPASPAPLKWEVTVSNWGNGRFLTLSKSNQHVVVVGNFTNNEGSYITKFPAMGEWYNYMNPTEKLQVNAATMSITVPANNFKMYTSFSTTSPQ